MSRATIRRAIKELVSEGLVEPRRGAGTFVVATGPLGEAPNRLMSFTELGAARGLRATAKVLAAVVRTATLDEAERFAIAPGADAFALTRLRFLEGLPVSVDQNIIPLTIAPSLPMENFESASLYDVLEASGASPVRADYTVEAVAADALLAEHLAVTIGSPILHAQTLSYTDNGRLVEMANTSYRGDRYRFRATLARRRW